VKIILKESYKMRNKKFCSTLISLSISLFSFMFIGGDCGTDSEPEQPPLTSVTPPQNVRVKVGQVSSWYATVSWSHSTDNSANDFKGYVVVTYQLDTLNNIVSEFSRNSVAKSQSLLQLISNLAPLVRYRSYVYSETNNGIKSDSIATKIYAPVFENSAVEIDEFDSTSTTSKSGFGWNTTFGIGTQYLFTTSNAASIDLHLRDAGNGLRFYSPDQYPPGIKRTYIDLVGSGQAAFDQTELSEPTALSLAISENSVYLLKTKENHYIKIWITKVETHPGESYQRVIFNYKVQPLEDFRIVKR